MTISSVTLRSFDYSYREPFQLKLASGDILHVQQVLRIMPGRRMVVFARWREQVVVAKLFYDAKRRKKHVDQELAGHKLLQTNKIPCAELFDIAISEDNGCRVLLFQNITSAKSLELSWRTSPRSKETIAALHAVIVELATQHVMGVLQRDLHLKNFLAAEEDHIDEDGEPSQVCVYTLDGGQIEKLPHLLDKKQSISTIALFLAQLGAGVETLQQLLFYFYANSRGWNVSRDDLLELQREIDTHNHKRWQRYERKIWRDCSDFVSQQRWNKKIVYDRRYATPAFMELLDQPEKAFTAMNGQFLKQGRSSTVVKVMVDDKEFVIKRYNLKDRWHRLRRALRATRATHCWRLAQKLKLFYVPTAAPVAMIEQRVFALRGVSYFIMEYVPAIHAGEFFKLYETNDDIIQEVTKRISLLLKSLFKLNLTHGDLKITNLLIDRQGLPLIVDLDGMREHHTKASLLSRWRKEVQRFLRNFDNKQTIRDQFAKELLRS